MPTLGKGRGGVHHARADHLDLALGQGAHRAELFALLEHLEAAPFFDLLPPELRQLLQLDDFRRLLFEGRAQGRG